MKGMKTGEGESLPLVFWGLIDGGRGERRLIPWPAVAPGAIQSTNEAFKISSRSTHLEKMDYTYYTSAKGCFLDCSLRVEMSYSRIQ